MQPRSRAVVALAALVVVGVGLAVTTSGHGPWADPTGDALYAALVYALVVLAVPRLRAPTAAGLAAGLCTLVELAQLTGAPAALVAHVPVARLVLGTTFVPLDLLAYAAGALLAALADVAVRRAAGARRRERVQAD